MEERGMGLIQRAVARMGQQNNPGQPIPASAATEPQAAAEPSLPNHSSLSARLSKKVVIDRGRLAAAGIALPSSERSRSAEEYRIIKRSVLRNAVNDSDRGRLIMVTSARPREGKTFTALNLALSLASERDMRVLLIDCDVHRQTLIDLLLGVEVERGLFDLLRDSQIDMSEVLLRIDNIPNLTVLPSGKASPLVHELLSSNKMKLLMDEMIRRYPDRYIVLDSPPCLATSDPSVLASLVGQVVFVVEAHRTQEQEISSSLRLISSCPNIGLVLNKTMGAGDHFGSYSYY